MGQYCPARKKRGCCPPKVCTYTEVTLMLSMLLAAAGASKNSLPTTSLKLMISHTAFHLGQRQQQQFWKTDFKARTSTCVLQNFTSPWPVHQALRNVLATCLVLCTIPRGSDVEAQMKTFRTVSVRPASLLVWKYSANQQLNGNNCI